MAPAGNTVRVCILATHDEATNGGMPSKSVREKSQKAAAGKQATANIEFEIEILDDGGVYRVKSRGRKCCGCRSAHASYTCGC